MNQPGYRRMDEEFSIEGKFWRKRFLEEQVPGTLAYSPETGVSIKLNGRLTPPKEAEVAEEGGILSVPIGDTHDDEPFTDLRGVLSDTSYVIFGKSYSGSSSTHLGSFAYALEEYTSSDCFCIRLPSESTKHVEWREAFVGFNLLAVWLRRFPFKAAWPGGTQKLEMSYERLLLGKDLIETEDHSSTFVEYPYQQREREQSYSVRNDVFIKVVSKEPQSEDWFRNKAYSYNSLLTILTADYFYPTRIGLRDGSQPRSDRLYEPQAVLINPPGHSARDHTPFASSMGFSFHDCKEDFPFLLRKWEYIREQYGRIVDLLLSCFDADKITVTSHYLVMVQALEGFHRNKYNTSYIDEDGYTEFLAVARSFLKDQAPKKLQGKLVGLLKHGNQYSLHDRLKELYTVIPPDLKASICSDWNRFVSRTAEYRNEIAHTLETRIDMTKVEDLADDYYRLQVCLVVLFWHELGFSPEQISAGAERAYATILRHINLDH